MARPAQANAAATKRKVLVTASTLFAQQGAGNTSMRAIAGGAGVSLGTVHHYFGSKAKLYDACIDAMYGELGTLWEELSVQPYVAQDLPAVFEGAVRRSYRFAREHHCAIRLVMREVIDSGEVSKQRRAQFVEPFFNRVTTLVAEVLGMNSVESRLLCQSMVNLVVRYALGSNNEQCLITGLKAPDSLAAVENHLVAIARTLFQIENMSERR